MQIAEVSCGVNWVSLECLRGYDVSIACWRVCISSVYTCSPIVHHRSCVFVTCGSRSLVYDHSSG